MQAAIAMCSLWCGAARYYRANLNLGQELIELSRKKVVITTWRYSLKLGNPISISMFPVLDYEMLSIALVPSTLPIQLYGVQSLMEWTMLN